MSGDGQRIWVMGARRRPQLAVAGALLALCLIAAGCGDDGEQPQAQEVKLQVAEPSDADARKALFCAPLTVDGDDPAGSLARRLIKAKRRSGGGIAPGSAVGVFLAAAPAPVADPAARLADAIEEGAAGAGVEALEDPEVADAIREVNRWADEGCPAPRRVAKPKPAPPN